MNGDLGLAPWREDATGAIRDVNGKWLGRLPYLARRLALASVNACVGIEDPVKLREQRDALLSGAIKLLEALDANFGVWANDVAESDLRDAVAACGEDNDA